MKFSTSITLGGLPVLLSGPQFEKTRAWRKANAIFCPLGPAPSRAWLLVSGKTIRALGVNDEHTIKWRQVSDAVGESRTLTMAGWRILNAERILQGGQEDDSSVFLVELVDARYRANNNNTVGLRANIRSFANTNDYLASTTGYTWSSLVEELWTDCAVLGAFPGLPAALPTDGVPEGLFLILMNSWRTLCKVLDQLDCAVKHNPLTNTYSIVQLGEAQVVNALPARLQWDGELIQGDAGVAATVRVHFYYHRKAYGQERDTERSTNWCVSGASDVIDLATGIVGSSGTVVLWDDQPWVLDETSTHTNNADNVARAANRKARYVTRMSVEPAHKIYSGLQTGYLPGGVIRACLFRSWGDNTNPLGGTVTEYVSGTDLITGLGEGGGPSSQFVWMDNGLITEQSEPWNGPDYNRHSFPTYPRIANVVQIHHTSGSPSAGDTVSPNADGFHKGRVKRWVDNAMVSLDDCWVMFVDDFDVNEGQVDGVQDEYYGPARLSGVTTSDASLLPVYLVKKGSSDVPGISFRNDSSEIVPAGGIMRVTGMTAAGSTTFTINKPNTEFQVRYLVNNSNSTVAVGATSTNGAWAEKAIYCAYDATDGAPAYGEQWGAFNDTWKLKKDRLGFIIQGGADGTKVEAHQNTHDYLFIKFTSTMTQSDASPASASADVYMLYDGVPAQWRNTGMTILAYDYYLNRAETIDIKTKGEVAWYGGHWVVRAAYCSPDNNGNPGQTPGGSSNYLLGNPPISGDNLWIPGVQGGTTGSPSTLIP